EHRLEAIDAAREALGEAGILVHARGERLRRLLPVCGPLLPIDLIVPREHAAQATKILERVLLAPLGRQGRAPASPRPVLVPAAMLAVAAGALLGVTVALRPPGLLKTSLEILAVDDDHDLFDRREKLPAGVALENAPLGPGRDAP